MKSSDAAPNLMATDFRSGGNRWVCRCIADDPDPAVTITDSAGCPNAFSTGGKTRNA
ncbi:hypothetical protein KP13_04783 [Klebsiella pneumoniae subsp. pneumoniae Kp13]|nr:hypothetical protein KP13_04783 [Klebsiella pneumoniae subsp. pneumoniae Kp13]